MAYHIVLHREMDLMAQDEQAQEGAGLAMPWGNWRSA